MARLATEGRRAAPNRAEETPFAGLAEIFDADRLVEDFITLAEWLRDREGAAWTAR
jgi:hypothetical protein